MKKEVSNTNKKNKIIFISIIVLVLIVILLISIVFINSKNDGMENRGISTIYYRTYTNENGWSEWTKDGLTSGDKECTIKSLQVKTKVNDGIIYYAYKESEGWSNAILSEENQKLEEDENVKGIKMGLYYGTSKNYELCYRTYNKKNGWLEWTCDGSVNGNINENVTAMQIKLIPRGVIKNEYLKNYNLSSNPTSIGF